MDASYELNRLRQQLLSSDLTESEVESIIDVASAEISAATLDIVSSAIQEVEAAGMAQNATRFLDELEAIRYGNSFEIRTASGRTDFSNAPFPMLPSLLKNAKTAKDGSLYKVIPVKDQSKTAISSYQVDQSRQKKLESFRKQINEGIDSRRAGNDALTATEAYAVAYTQTRIEGRNIKRNERSLGPVNFKTASSKQDASSAWVMPPKEQDFTGILMDVNARIRQQIDEIITDVINRYGA